MGRVVAHYSVQNVEGGFYAQDADEEGLEPRDGEFDRENVLGPQVDVQLVHVAEEESLEHDAQC